MQNKLTILLLLLNVQMGLQANLFLTKPHVLLSDKIEQLTNRQANKNFNFSWRLSPLHTITYFTANQKTGFVLWVKGIPIYSYNFISIYNIKKSSAILKQKIQNLFKTESMPEKNYFLTKPLKYTNPNPIKIDFDHLNSLLQNKKFIFYTGAGLSAASNVPTMNALEKSLKINLGLKNWLKAAISNPQELAQNFAQFHKDCMFAQPTPAHYAISKISQFNHTAIITENVDLLQHKTGCAPEHTQGDQVYLATAQDYQALDYIICVGLSHDDCGFIANYKQHNPFGKIIALDLGLPNYLGDTDYLLQADLQEVLANLATLY